MVALEPGNAQGVAQAMPSDVAEAEAPSAPIDRRTPPAKVYQRFYEDFMAIATPDDAVTAENIALLSGMIAAVHDEVADATKRGDEAHQKADALLPGMENAAILLDLMSRRIVELERSIDDLMAGSAVGSNQPPRFRRNYSPPTKDRGWNCEHTVESAFPMTDEDRERIAAEDARAYELVEAECIRRDAAEGRVRRYFT